MNQSKEKVSNRTRVILEAKDIVKIFPGVRALNHVDFCVYRGCLNALVGENGAGKSTLMKVLAGIYQPDSGGIFLDGNPIQFNDPRHARQHGIAVIHQELSLIPYLSIAENIFLGYEFRNRFGLVDYGKMHREASRLLKMLDLHIKPDRPVSSLSVGQQQAVEIARSLSMDATIIIMDEPTSAISEHEIDVLFELIENLKGQGVSFVYISHKLDELFRIGDYITVMRDGEVIGKDSLSNLNHDAVVRMMVGRDLKDLYRREASVTSDEALRVEQISLDNSAHEGCSVSNISFHVNRGEVLGVFGLMGAGRTDLLETIFGRHPKRSSGDIFIQGKKLCLHSPKDAIEAGVVLAPEDRKEQGLVLGMTVVENMTLANLQNVQRFGFLQKTTEARMADTYIERLRIKTPSGKQKVKNLSGGNQQKVILGKWLATQPVVLLLDEPTRGIDINAKREIYRLIDELTEQGLAVVMVSSELPEILGLSDRILVMSEGKKTAEYPRGEATEEAILTAALPKSA